MALCLFKCILIITYSIYMYYIIAGQHLYHILNKCDKAKKLVPYSIVYRLKTESSKLCLALCRTMTVSQLSHIEGSRDKIVKTIAFLSQKIIFVTTEGKMKCRTHYLGLQCFFKALNMFPETDYKSRGVMQFSFGANTSPKMLLFRSILHPRCRC